MSSPAPCWQPEFSMGIVSNFQAFSDWLELTTTRSDGSNLSSELDGNESEWGGSSTTLESPPKVDIDAISGSKFDGNLDEFREGQYSQSSGSCTEGSSNTFMWQMEWKLVDLPDVPTRARIPINTSRLDPTAPVFVPGNPFYNAFPVLDQHRQYYPWQQQSARHIPRPQPVTLSQHDYPWQQSAPQIALPPEITFSQNDGYISWSLPKSRFSKYQKRYPNSHGRVSRRPLISRKKMMGLWASCEQIYAAESQKKDRYYSAESSQD